MLRPVLNNYEGRFRCGGGHGEADRNQNQQIESLITPGNSFMGFENERYKMIVEKCSERLLPEGFELD